MHIFLHLRLRGFYIRAYLEKHSDLAERPLVVHRKKAVLDASLPALERGVSLDMPLAEAKAILRDGAFITWEEEPYRASQHQWLDICTEFSDVIEPDDQHTAHLDLSNHPDPFEIALKLASSIESSGWACEIGMGRTKWIAQLATSPTTNNKLVKELRLREPIVDSAAFLADLPVEDLIPVPEALRARLRFLGYKTIGHVAALPLSLLQSQFDEYGLLISQAASGGCFEPVQAFYPPDAVIERFAFDGPVDEWPTIQLAVRTLADRLSTRLKTKDLQGDRLVVWLDREEGSSLKADRTFTKPLQSAEAIAPVLEKQIEEMLFTSDPDAVAAIRVWMPGLTKAKRIQPELTGKASLNERKLATDAAFRHVRQVFGDQAVHAGAEIQEPRRKRVLKVWRDVTGWR